MTFAGGSSIETRVQSDGIVSAREFSGMERPAFLVI